MAHEYFKVGTTQALINAVKARTAEKPDSDALSPLLTAGAALGITGEATDSAAWLQRVSTSDGPTTIRSIHGRTVRWNQRVAQVSGAINGNQGTKSFDSSTKVWTITCTDATGTNFGFYTVVGSGYGVAAGHKSLFCADLNLSTAGTVRLGAASAQAALVAVGTEYTRVAAIISPSSSGGATAYTNGAEGLTMQVKNVQIFDLTDMFGAGSEPSTIEEFTALYPLPYYAYDAGSLLPVNMTGIETTWFNQWDEQWELGTLNTSTGAKTDSVIQIRSKNFIPAFPSTEYCNSSSYTLAILAYDADKGYIGFIGNVPSNRTFTTPANCGYLRFYRTATAYNNDICINISDPTSNGEYEPYLASQRSIPAGTLRGAGSVYDEQTETERITRVGEVDLGSLTWGRQKHPTEDIYRFRAAIPGAKIYDTTSQIVDELATTLSYVLVSANATFSADDSMALGGDSSGTYMYVRDDTYTDTAAFKAAMSGVMLHYALATPTTTPIDPALNLTYRTEQGGTERVMVPTGEQSAPPTIMAAQGYTAESLRDAALSAIAPVENGLASTNYGVGAYLVHGGQLCKVTTAIATGEAITIGTNVTATTVMAEVIALAQ